MSSRSKKIVHKKTKKSFGFLHWVPFLVLSIVVLSATIGIMRRPGQQEVNAAVTNCPNVAKGAFCIGANLCSSECGGSYGFCQPGHGCPSNQKCCIPNPTPTPRLTPRPTLAECPWPSTKYDLFVKRVSCQNGNQSFHVNFNNDKLGSLPISYKNVAYRLVISAVYLAYQDTKNHTGRMYYSTSDKVAIVYGSSQEGGKVNGGTYTYPTKTTHNNVVYTLDEFTVGAHDNNLYPNVCRTYPPNLNWGFVAPQPCSIGQLKTVQP